MPVAATITDWEQDERTPAAADSTAQYLSEIGRYPLLDRTEEIQLARRAEAGDERARQRLVECNLRLVVAIAHDYEGHGIDLQDLIQEGNLGLLTAAQRYDWRRNVKFSAYARLWVRQAIFRAVSDRSRLVRLPTRVADAAAGVTRIERELEQELGGTPTIEAVAEAASVPPSVVDDIRRSRVGLVSLDGSSDDRPAYDELLGDEHAVDPAEHATTAETRECVCRAVASLDPQGRRVVELRYGLGEGEARTLQDVSDEIGVSPERVRQLETRALRKLAKRSELRPLLSAA